MKISDFLKESLSQINDACTQNNCQFPSEVEFIIKVNEKIEICSNEEYSVATLKIKLCRF